MDQPPAASKSDLDTAANEPSFPPQTEGGSLGFNPPAPAEELLLQDQPSPITTSPPSPPPQPPPPPPQPEPPAPSQQPELNELAQDPSDESNGNRPAWFSSRIALALLIIVLAGVLVFGISLIFQRKSSESAVTPPSQVAQVAKPLILSIESPADGTIVTNGEVLVKGKTSPNTLVVFYTDDNDNSVESDSSGNFEGKLALNQGVNTLTVTATNADGDEKTVVLDVVYDQE